MAQTMENSMESNVITLKVYVNDEIVEKDFQLNELLAICTKAYYEPATHKGGALVFVKGQEAPFVTADEVTTKKIMGRLAQNPNAKQLPLIAKGSSNLHLLKDAYHETEKYIVLKSGAKLLLKADR